MGSITPYPGMADDLRAVLDLFGGPAALPEARARIRAAIVPEPCGHPSKWHSFQEGRHHDHEHGCVGGCTPLFRCSLPRDHHFPYATDNTCHTCGKPADDPVHCGDKHVAPEGVWS